jgi:hypothetical protein
MFQPMFTGPAAPILAILVFPDTEGAVMRLVFEISISHKHYLYSKL